LTPNNDDSNNNDDDDDDDDKDNVYGAVIMALLLCEFTRFI